MSDQPITPVKAGRAKPCLWCDKSIEVGSSAVKVVANIPIPMVGKVKTEHLAHSDCAYEAGRQLQQMSEVARKM